ncbi:MAG: DUF6383 domain-containing protein [Candidatus Symbiothrix sp.]|jgi:hypothetical protein|nr:DUF6383 domain-containing protein [Candidatus Symbiothrix sp.]
MKKITLLFVAIVLLFSAQTMKAQFAGGDGSEANPYQISNRAELRALDDYINDAGAGKHFVLTADIDLAGELWVPIATDTLGSEAAPTIATTDTLFRGKLHGQGYKIQNMTTKAKGPWLTGLFGQIGAGALIEDVHIVGGAAGTNDASGVKAYNKIGSLVGRVYLNKDATEGITITKCSNNVSVTDPARNSNTGNSAGGLIGEIINENLAQDVILSLSYNTGDVAGGMHAAGLVGRIVGYAEIKNCYFNGTVNRNYFTLNDEINSTTGEVTNPAGSEVGMNGGVFRGGLVGYFNSGENPGFIENCYAAGVVNNNSRLFVQQQTSVMYAGGITARKDASTEIRNSVALQTVVSGIRPGISTFRVSGYTATTGSTLLTNNYAISTLALTDSANVVVTPTVATVTGQNGADVTPAAAKTKAFYEGLGWNFTDIWTIAEGASFPTLKSVATGIQSPKSGAKTLKASVSNGALTVTGLTAGESVRIYTVVGQTVANVTATGTRTTINLPTSGIYIVSAGNQAVKVVAGK